MIYSPTKLFALMAAVNAQQTCETLRDAFQDNKCAPQTPHPHAFRARRHDSVDDS